MRLLATMLTLPERLFRGSRKRLRSRYYRARMRSMGSNCRISEGVYIAGPEFISLGDRVVINDRVILQSCEGATLTIGDDVNIAYGALLLTGNLDLSEGIDRATHVGNPIVVEDEALIGARALVLPGITIGRAAVVSAGSVVTQDVQPHTIVFGNPARVIKRFSRDQK